MVYLVYLHREIHHKSPYNVRFGPAKVLEKSLVLIHQNLWEPCIYVLSEQYFLMFMVWFQYIEPRQGHFIDFDTGEIIGYHKGTMCMKAHQCHKELLVWDIKFIVTSICSKVSQLLYKIVVCDTVETLYSTIYYSKYFIELNIDKSTQYVALWTHKRHPIPRPFGRAMECLLWVLQQKLIVL